MKHASLALFLTGLALSCAACKATPGQYLPALQALQVAAEDGVVTPEEAQAVISQLPKPGFDWVQAAEVGGSVLASILGVKFLPERHLRSPFDQPQPPQ